MIYEETKWKSKLEVAALLENACKKRWGPPWTVLLGHHMAREAILSSAYTLLKETAEVPLEVALEVIESAVTFLERELAEGRL